MSDEMANWTRYSGGSTIYPGDPSRNTHRTQWVWCRSGEHIQHAIQRGAPTTYIATTGPGSHRDHEPPTEPPRRKLREEDT